MINYNGSLIPSLSAPLEIHNRGFQYGDGIFETIIIENGVIRFFDEHWERLLNGVQLLKLELSFDKSKLLEMIQQLQLENKLLHKNVRAKLLVWRKAGGLYMPLESQSEFCLVMQDFQRKSVQYFSKVEISNRVQLYKSQWSHMKTISAFPYIMAGIEKNERQLEELILLNQDGFIAEASASNIYFFDVGKKILYTPSLESACINGVSRRFLFKNAVTKNIKVEEVMWQVADIKANFLVFAINVAGLNQITNIGSMQFEKNPAGLELIHAILN